MFSFKYGMLVLFLISTLGIGVATAVDGEECEAVRPSVWERVDHPEIADYSVIRVYFYWGEDFVDGLEFRRYGSGLAWVTSGSSDDLLYCPDEFESFLDYSLRVLNGEQETSEVYPEEYNRFLRGTRPYKVYIPMISEGYGE